MIELPYRTKPLFGQKCNGCGLCCALERCLVSVTFLGDGPGPCPALEYRDGRAFCGMMEHPSKYDKTIPPDGEQLDALIIRVLLLEGKGCGMED